ncbi:branched-chain amino acid ABC transporter ATP-binding protein/permease [Herbiconiux sp. CPCC 203407]|uniref:Branched-chain amino acid ABC transporter ATP-binding protein/permease n=1 Tax=Herbiconiux oxytropis TaxID=2970915 RepID=A0AA41XH85_9MICO|nr:branched-chain amino acid ABC transporter ATP-binding protein/permease [Herbiconiux oxytropis]MCS5723401.1 branched-chain amino acid ABC transporter ATP-binding protein/permease [Herbiconiux oxytropis]MCS5727952.1 branched-chain amino acid ABC transporter ATP-binding protein/permease [Herbiconiux oxytropis]
MEYYADIAIQIMFLMMLALSLNLLVGYTGETSMAQAAFYGIGAYTVGLLTMPVAVAGLEIATSSGVAGGAGWPFWPAVLISILVSAAVASAISIPALSRVRGEFLILMTLAFQLVTTQLMGSLTSITGGTFGLTPIPPMTLFGQSLIKPSQVVIVVGIATVLTFVFCYRLGESPFGRVLKGIREQETAVRAVGKGTVLPKVIVFGVAAGVAGLAGALNASYYQVAAPQSFNLDVSILAIAVVILGGVANPVGTVVAAILLGLLNPVLDALVGAEASAWRGVIYGLALVLVMRYRPQGLIPEHQGPLRFLRRRRRRNAAESAAPARSERDRVPGAAPTATDAAASRPAPEVVLSVEGMSKSFGGIKAVSDATFDLTRGQITALVGPNGAGKTTLFNLITNAITPDQGAVTLNGTSITGLSISEIARRGMARSFQDGRLFERLSALDNVAMAIPDQRAENPFILTVRPLYVQKRERAVRQSALECLQLVGMHADAETLVADLSYGDQKLVAIARLIATGADVLLLDEPTSGVDPSAVEHVIDVISDLRAAGKTICLVEHSVHMVERLADRAVFLDQGRVLAMGSMKELMARQDLKEIYFGA